MKLILPLSDLKKALKDVSYIVPGNPVVPILENVIFEVKDGRVTLTSCDLMSTVKSWFNVSGQPDCEALLPFKITQSLLSKINTPEIEIEVKESHVAVTTGKSKARISVEDVKDWPTAPEMSEVKNKMIVSSQTLIEAIHKTEYAMSTDDIRSNLMQINMLVNEGRVTARSMDGHRGVMFEFDVESKGSFTLNTNWHLSKCKSLFAEPQPLTFRSDENRYSVEGDQALFESRLIEEKFPALENVVPDTRDGFKSTFDKSQMISELERCVMFSDKVDKKVALTFFQRNINISTSDIQHDYEYSGDVEADVIGDEIMIGVNGAYLKEALSRFDDDQIDLYHMGAANKVIVLKDENYTAILMPVTL